jgi:hypothetical protein
MRHIKHISTLSSVRNSKKRGKNKKIIKMNHFDKLKLNKTWVLNRYSKLVSDNEWKVLAILVLFNQA